MEKIGCCHDTVIDIASSNNIPLNIHKNKVA
jgi:hypothetical protein